MNDTYTGALVNHTVMYTLVKVYILFVWSTKRNIINIKKVIAQ